MNKLSVFLSIITATACATPAPEIATAQAPLVSYGEDVWITLAAGNNNNLDLGGGAHGFYTLVPNASGSTVTGIDASMAAAGDAIYIRNGSATIPLVLGHAHTSSDEYNRMTMPYSTDFTVEPGRSVLVHFWTHDGATLGWAIELEPGMYGVTSTATPSHTMGSAWQNTTGRPVLGMYSVRITTDLTLTSGETGRVELAIGAGSGSQPTLCGRVAHVAAGSLSIGVSTSYAAEAQLSCVIPPRWWGILRSTNEVGTPAYSITNQLEQAL